jgi:Protein of unknown function (DUF4031)
MILIDYPCKGGFECHMFGSTEHELREFGKRIGLKDKYFRINKGVPFYRVYIGRKTTRRAFENGATRVNKKQVTEFLRLKYGIITHIDFEQTETNLDYRTKCKKLRRSQEEAERVVSRDLLAYLNNGKTKERRQVHAYYCYECKAWHTTTIRNPVFVQ